MDALLLAVGLVAYNNAANLWPPFNTWLYVPANLSAAVVVIVLALGPLGLEAEEIWGGPPRLDDLLVGTIIGAAFTTPLFMLLVARRALRWLADERVAGLSNGPLVYQVLVRIPVGTALLEELAFRGVLYAAWADRGTTEAALMSSVAFGLWHISPTINLMRANRPGAALGRTALVVVGAVAFTTVAGLGLVWLRLDSGSIAAPWALHATLNGMATVAGVLAHRRLHG